MEYKYCVKCSKPKEQGDECPYCGVYYAKAEANHNPDTEEKRPKEYQGKQDKGLAKDSTSSQTGETAVDRWKSLPESDKKAVRKLGVFTITAIIIFAMWAWTSPENKNRSPEKQQPFTVEVSGSKNKNLGTLSALLSSQEQARELLDLIDSYPGRNSYQITYKTTDDIVIFGCNFNQNVLLRIHNRPNGSGTAESWSDDIASRLRQAAAGNSLNDTLNGKRPGTFTRF